MKKTVKTLSCILTVVMLFCHMKPVLASPQFTEVNGDLSLEEGAEEFVQTEENLEILEKKLAGLDQTENKMGQLSAQDRAGTPNFIKVELSVPYYVQANNYYCGPATVKEIVQYYNGSSGTQAYYANLLGTTTNGTDMTYIPSVLNSSISSSIYAYDDTWTSFSQWATRVMASIDAGNPVVADISTSGVTMLQIPYVTTGHYVAIIGYSYDTRSNTLASVKIADSHPTYYGIYWYPSSDLYTANDNHFRHAILW